MPKICQKKHTTTCRRKKKTNCAKAIRRCVLWLFLCFFFILAYLLVFFWWPFLLFIFVFKACVSGYFRCVFRVNHIRFYIEKQKKKKAKQMNSTNLLQFTFFFLLISVASLFNSSVFFITFSNWKWIIFFLMCNKATHCVYVCERQRERH